MRQEEKDMDKYFTDLVNNFTAKKLFVVLVVGFVIGIVLALIVNFDISRQIDAKKGHSTTVSTVQERTVSEKKEEKPIEKTAEEGYAKRSNDYAVKIFLEDTDKNVSDMQQYLIHRERHTEANAVIKSKSVLDRYQRAIDLIDDKVLAEYIEEDRDNWKKVEPVENEWTSLEWKELKLRHEELILEAKRLQLQRLQEK